jgi:hypothetical protein
VYKLHRVLTIGLPGLLLLAAVGLGQPRQGSLTVTVEGEDGSRVSGVSALAESPRTLTRRAAVTGESGLATLRGLDPAPDYAVILHLGEPAAGGRVETPVHAGRDTAIHVLLRRAPGGDGMILTTRVSELEATSTLTGEALTPERTEALPTTRSYQDYLQLVPGVLPDVSGSDNPAARSGLNYRDIGGDLGASSDNVYFLEGIQVTDNVTGLAAAGLNPEVIEEQMVLTGGLPAEFAGAPGLVSNVITKSGGNRLSGSLSYFFQQDGLVAENEHKEDAAFGTFDIAATLGGPIVQDEAWFFASFRRVERDDDVFTQDTDEFLRTVNSTADQGFGKITWAPSQRDLISGTFLSDPTDFSGQRDNALTNARDFARDQGGDRATVNYSRVFRSASLDLGYTDHQGDLNDTSVIPEARNDIVFRSTDSRTQQEEQLGGNGTIDIEDRGNEAIRGALEYLVDSSWGDHTLKAGFELTENQNFRNFGFFGGARYTSLSARVLGQGITAFDVANKFSQVEFNPTNPSDTAGLRRTIDASANRADFYALLDTDGDGFISDAEIANLLVFDSTQGNPHGQINYDRLAQVSSGAQLTKSEGTVLYLQDAWQYERWSLNAGLRAETWQHFATTGKRIFTFGAEIAPRIGIAYDIGGDGKQRLSAYYGRYHDPIRNDITNFAGTVSGGERHEQVWVQGGEGSLADGQWVTYQVRGGPRAPDALFAPTTRTPYTDEIQLGYARDLGRHMSIEGNLVRRRTRALLEDYDLDLYAFRPDGTTDYPGPTDHPDSLFLGLGYFGFDTFPGSRYVIATLAGAERSWDGAELVFRKRLDNKWQMLASYTYADAEGSSNSDSNSDFQGDVLWLDPRAPNQRGPQPGLVEHLFKIHASYRFDSSLTIGGAYRWSSGALTSRTFRASGRNLPCTTAPLDVCPGIGETPITFAGITDEPWVAPGVVGSVENPAYGTLDLRLAYLWDINGRLEADFFVDVFNVFDNQATTQRDWREDLPLRSGRPFELDAEFLAPRRVVLGARLRF